jgi:AcrR family transcriptional regulator
MPPAQRREALIEATLPLLIANGADVTTRQIAEACGVAEGTLFRVFPDKESLIQAAVARAFEPEQVLAKLRAIEPGLPLEERLVAAVDILRIRLEGIFTLLNALRWQRRPEQHGTKPPGHYQRDADIVAAIVEVVGTDSVQFRYSAVEAMSLLRLLVFAGTHPFISGGNPLTSRRIVAYLMDGVRQTDPTAPAKTSRPRPKSTPNHRTRKP